MSGYWERVIAEYTRGGLTFGVVPRLMGKYLLPFYDSSIFFGGNFTTVQPGLRLTFLVPFINPVNALFSNAAVNITTGKINRFISLAIYKETFAVDEIVTGTEILQLERKLGTVPTDIGGVVYSNPGVFELSQGFYYLAIECSDAVIAVSAFVTSVGSPSIFGYDPANLLQKRNLLTADNSAVIFGDWQQILPVYVQGGIGLPRIFLEFQEVSPGAP